MVISSLKFQKKYHWLCRFIIVTWVYLMSHEGGLNAIHGRLGSAMKAGHVDFYRKKRLIL